MRTQDTHAHTAAGSTTAGVTLDDLTRMGVAELGRIYEQGSVPGSLAALDGTPHGRMLALVGPAGRGPALGAIRRVAASRAFPWRGKSFRSKDATHGEGINRAIVLGDLYRFETRIDTSAIDGAPCVLLNYDLPENPFFIRAIRDELREVAPGLFLGPAMLDGDRPKLVLYFAIDTTVGG